MATVIFRIREIVSPIMGDPRGYRFLVALPNMAARTMSGSATPSFDKPYYITHFGDFVDMDDVVLAAPKIRVTLSRMGFDKLVMIGD